MKTKLVLVSLALLLSITACSADQKSDDVDMNKIVYEASENLPSHVDEKAITESLFKQFRPRVVINDLSLSKEEVDAATRKYIRENYTPVLIKNYIEIFSKFEKTGMTFQDRKEISPIDKSDDVLESLCIDLSEKEATISYMTNGYSKGWSATSTYTFSIVKNKATLTAIDVKLHKNTKVSISGV